MTRNEQLGMNYSTASSRLKKMIMLRLLQELGKNWCYKCNKIIESYEDLSIEHKEPWLHISSDLFWDLENIAFSHKKCNAPNRACKGKRKVNSEGEVWCVDCEKYLSENLFSKRYHNQMNRKIYRPRCKKCLKDKREREKEKIYGKAKT